MVFRWPAEDQDERCRGLSPSPQISGQRVRRSGCFIPDLQHGDSMGCISRIEIRLGWSKPCSSEKGPPFLGAPLHAKWGRCTQHKFLVNKFPLGKEG